MLDQSIQGITISVYCAFFFIIPITGPDPFEERFVAQVIPFGKVGILDSLFSPGDDLVLFGLAVLCKLFSSEKAHRLLI